MSDELLLFTAVLWVGFVLAQAKAVPFLLHSLHLLSRKNIEEGVGLGGGVWSMVIFPLCLSMQHILILQ